MIVKRKLCAVYTGVLGGDQLDVDVKHFLIHLVCLCLNECLTVDAQYKILHALSADQAISEKKEASPFHTELENVA